MDAEISSRYQNLLLTLVTLLESRNPYNIEHCRLVAHYSDNVARKAGLDGPARERLARAAELHTLGVHLQMEEKRAHQSLPITRLGLRSGREHPMQHREGQILRSILGGIEGLDECVDIVVQRHEWFDGTGSLLGKKGETILPEARALAVADAFVDLATPKSHREPVTLPEVLSRIESQSGTQFDPRFVAALGATVREEEERWGAVARARQFEAARFRHYLSIGNFHRQCAEPEWALRCYRAAAQIAERTKDVDQQILAVYGTVTVYSDQQDYQRVREALNAFRPALGESQGKARQWFMLLWGLLEWNTGNEQNGEQILEGVAQAFANEQDVAGVTAATAVLCSQHLQRRGTDDPAHLKGLRRFMELLSHHDLFDVVVQYRPQTLPLLLSAVLHGIEPALARGILTRMGEPVHGDLLKKLSIEQPEVWMKTTPVAQPSSSPSVPVTVQVADSAPPAALQVKCLGPFLVESNRRIVGEEEWPTQKAMKLFALLAFRRGATFTDEGLMELFWPDRDEVKARSSLRNAVHQIRALLGELLDASSGELVYRSRRMGTISIHCPYGLDSEAFERGVVESVQHFGEGRPGPALSVVQAALALYRGEFLEGVRDEWVLGPRTTLAESYLRGLQLKAQCHLALDDPESAEISARKALALDDLREQLHAALIESLLAQGRRTDALRHYHDAIAHFKREIGLATPVGLTSLYERLVR